MKKLSALIMALVLTLSFGVFFAHAEVTADVLVTIVDKNGKIVVDADNVIVTDSDGDSVLTVNDALYAAHERFYDGGAAAGYAAENTKWGLSLAKLWGTANGGSYGYMVNNIPANSLSDPIKEDDYIAAYVFTDTKTFTDKYSFFEKPRVDLGGVDELELTLMKNDFDEDWNPVTLPVSGAEITVDGEPTGVLTDENGKARVKFGGDGRFVVSATAKDQVIVPPICRVDVILPPRTPDPIDVLVTVADKDGKLALAAEKVTVEDIDDDKKLTVNDVLYAAHEQFYDGGAAAGYGTETTQWGLSLAKLWGTANGGSYGYTVNHIASQSLADPVGDGDYVAAYVFTDTVTFADKYAYFDKVEVELTDGSSLELTLKKNDFDADWNPVTEPVAGAELTIDGKPTGVYTGADGKATLEFAENGRFLISATAADQVIVPPVCYVNVALEEDPEGEEPTGFIGDPPVDTEEPSDNPEADLTQATQEEPTEEETETAEQPTQEATEPDGGATPDSATPDSPSSGTPQTGDHTMLWLWILIAVVCAAGACATVVIYKKHNAKK